MTKNKSLQRIHSDQKERLPVKFDPKKKLLILSRIDSIERNINKILLYLK